MFGCEGESSLIFESAAEIWNNKHLARENLTTWHTCHAMICNIKQNYLKKVLPYTNGLKMQSNALLSWQNFIIAKVGVTAQFPPSASG
jgi:hypothetical protein